MHIRIFGCWVLRGSSGHQQGQPPWHGVVKELVSTCGYEMGGALTASGRIPLGG